MKSCLQNHSRKYICQAKKCIDDNFLTLETEEPKQGSALLYLILMKKEELVWGVKVRGTFGYSVHKLIEFSILGGGNRTKSSIPTMEFKRMDFGPSKDLLKKIPWEMILE